MPIADWIKHLRFSIYGFRFNKDISDFQFSFYGLKTLLLNLVDLEDVVLKESIY